MELKDRLIVLLSLLIFYVIVTASISGLYKAIGVGTLMYLTGEYLKNKYKLEGEYGLIMLKTEKGLRAIARAAKKYQPWLEVWVDIFIGASFGIIGIAFMSWRNLKEKVIIALLSFLLITLIGFVSPLSISFLFQIMHNMGDMTQHTSEWIFIVQYIIGIAGSMTVSLFTSAANTLIKFGMLLSGSNVEIKSGATLLLPGINLPLVEGILALGILLIIHEGSHGLLSVIGRIKLLSAGIALFGTLPVGGFIEPDEKMLEKSSRKVQSRIYVAGSASNLTATFIFLIAFIVFAYFTSQYAAEGCLVIGGDVIKPGTVIYSINNDTSCNINNSTNTIHLLTNNGEITLNRGNDGKFGFYILKLDKEYIMPRVYNNPWMQFIYNFLGLSFALNLVVGIVNLLPIPFFDGQHLIYTLFGKNTITKAIVYLSLISLVIILLPGIF